ncbi:MAG: CDP-alcohol phosphatidyltransferase family protein [Muribaculaceae bacterium]|nr:CDP-alcohol phosphatidyltransferase family protein [Muribaculaceae bacterium]
MSVKTTAKRMRDALQQGIYAVINPLVKLMIAIGMTPNMVTTIGLLGNIAGAAVMVYAGYLTQQTGLIPWNLVIWSGGLIIGFSLFDMLDGQVARLGGMASTFGAMYDSVLDRYCELFTLGGIAYYFMMAGTLWEALVTYLAVIGSIMVSYVRARAEGLGLECKIGFMQRPERVVVTALGLLLTGILGSCGVEWANMVLYVAMIIIAVFANLTAFARIAHSKSQLKTRK